MLHKLRKTAAHLVTNREKVVKVKRHDPTCAGLPAMAGLPQAACNCNRKGHAFAVVLREGK
jgi:hypothetical protein